MTKRKSPPVQLEDEETGGRKRVRIDEVTFAQACKLQCTVEELAAFFDVSLITMKRRLREPKYRELFDRARSLGQLSIRRQQFTHMKMANSAGVQMTIHLSKVHLGETEKSLLELTGKGGGPVETKDVSARELVSSRIAGIAARKRAPEDPKQPDRRAG